MIARSSGGWLAWRDRRAVARMVGLALPAAAGDVRYARWQASSDLAYYEAVICFSCSREVYLEFMRARDMTPFSVTGRNVHLPTTWEPAPDLQPLPWWTASS